jgi:hypothetical protein
VVVVALAVVLGVLIAKPWDTQPGPAPVAVQPAPSEEPAAPTQSAQSAPSDAPSPRTTGTPIPYPPYTPTPAPSEPESPPEGSAFAVEFDADGQVATCRYERRGRRYVLSVIEVPPPRAYAVSDRGTGRVRGVSWWFELLGNREDTLFDADWQPLGQSGIEVAASVDGGPADFTLNHRFVGDLDLSRTAVVRTRVVVHWDSQFGEPEVQSEIVATSYLMEPRPPVPPLTYCPAVIRR